MKSHFGYLANSVDPDQPADQDLHFFQAICKLVHVRSYIHLLKIASDGNFILLLWKTTSI